MKHQPTCTCGKCERDRASREHQKAVAQAKMTGSSPPAPPPPPKKPKPIITTADPRLYSGGYYYLTSSINIPNVWADSVVRAKPFSDALMRDMVLGGPTDTPPLITIDSIPEETDLVRGWRTYTIDALGRLKGSRAAWETAEFVATCEAYPAADVVQHLLNGCGSDHAGCGIYSHKVGPEYLKTDRLQCTNVKEATAQNINVVAQCISSGVVVEHEYGYRAEKCRIEQMWLVTPRRCGNGHWVKMEQGQAGSSQGDWVHYDSLHLWVNYRTNELINDVMVRDAVYPGALFTRNSTPTPPRWTCSETPVENPGAAYAQVLSTKYGVPCIGMPTAEFIAKLDEGSL